MSRRVAAAALVAALLTLGPPLAEPARAHVQVRPTEAAPRDPVLWTVLVPNEREAETTRIELAIPDGVAPFSYNDRPGWKRSLTLERDRSVRSIVWEGRLASDGLAELSFLATTPDTEGTIEWKALQTYEDGTIVRWIGAPGSDEPASATTITASAPRENAGGEGDPETPAAPAPAEAGDGRDALAIALGGVALLVALVAVWLAAGRDRLRGREQARR